MSEKVQNRIKRKQVLFISITWVYHLAVEAALNLVKQRASRHENRMRIKMITIEK